MGISSAFGFKGFQNGTGAGAPAGTGANGQEYWDLTAKRLYKSDGSGWIIFGEPEQTYTPTWTNVTLGTGSARTGTYKRSDGYVDWTATVTLGTGGTVTGGVTVSTPVAFDVNIRYAHAGCYLHDSGVNDYRGICNGTSAGATVMAIYCVNASGPLENANDLSAILPFVWASGDAINVQGHSKMSTRYL